MRKTKLLCVTLALLLLASAGGCATAEDDAAGLETVAPELAHVVDDASWYSDFSVQGDKVYITCVVTVACSEATELQIYGDFREDAGKLLKNPLLLGQLGDDSNRLQSTAALPRGQTELRVVFVGDFAGTDQKQNRLLPQLYLVAPAQSDK